MSMARDLAEFFAPLRYRRPAAAGDRSCGDADRQHARQRGAAARTSQSRRRSSATSRASAAATPQASLWFDAGPKLPAAEAAQVNAVMSDAAASDDSDLRNIVHCGTPLTATALALAERTGASGERRAGGNRPRLRGGRADQRSDQPGFRDPRLSRLPVAIFAAAVAAGRLLRLDAEQMAQAIALAATSIGGLVTAADTSVAREYHAGLATLRHRGRAARRSADIGPRNASSKCAPVSSKPMAGGRSPRQAASRARSRPELGHHHRYGGQAGAGRPSLPRPRRGRRQCRARGQHRPERGRKHHRVAARLHRADRAAAPGRSDRHGAQPGLFPRRRGRRPRFLLGARDARQDRRPARSTG